MNVFNKLSDLMVIAADATVDTYRTMREWHVFSAGLAVELFSELKQSRLPETFKACTEKVAVAVEDTNQARDTAKTAWAELGKELRTSLGIEVIPTESIRDSKAYRVFINYRVALGNSDLKSKKKPVREAAEYELQARSVEWATVRDGLEEYEIEAIDAAYTEDIKQAEMAEDIFAESLKKH